MTTLKTLAAATCFALLSATSATAGAGSMTGLKSAAKGSVKSRSAAQKIHFRYRWHCHGYYQDFCHGGGYGGGYYVPECFLHYDFGVICLGDYGYSRGAARAAARSGRARSRGARRLRRPQTRQFRNRGPRAR